MSYMIWRVSRVDSPGSLRGHIQGRQRNVSIGEEFVRANGLAGFRRLADGSARTKDVIALGDMVRVDKKIRGRKGAHYEQMMFAGPPPFDDPECWTAKKIQKWEDRCLEWVRLVFPSAHIDIAEAHYDETSPHLHILIVPVCKDGRISWKRLQREGAELVTNREGQHLSNLLERGTIQMRELQDSCWSFCGKPFGLERGEPGSTRKHESTDHLRAAEAHAREIERRSREELERERRQSQEALEEEWAALKRELYGMLDKAIVISDNSSVNKGASHDPYRTGKSTP